MTIYVASSEVDIFGAHFDENEETMQVWFAYREPSADRHRGVNTAQLVELRADGGKDEVIDALADLPDARIRGDHRWAEQARGDTDEK